MLSSSLKTEESIEGFALVAAPVLFATSTFYWHNGEYNVISATLLILSLFFWLPALRGLFSITSQALPRYSIWGLWIAYFGCISGVCFAFLGYITTVLNVTHQEYLEALSHYPVTAQLLLFASGPIFPLSMLILGIQMLRKKVVPLGIALLLCIAGIAFPVSRISRIEIIAHIADLALLVPCLYISFKGLHKQAAG
jgi:hypothetical protein